MDLCQLDFDEKSQIYQYVFVKMLHDDPGAHRRKRFLDLKWGELSQPTGWPEIAALLRTHFKFVGSLIALSKPCGSYVGPLCARSGRCKYHGFNQWGAGQR